MPTIKENKSNYNLSACPFCSGKAIFSPVSAEAGGLNVRIRFHVKCRNCGASKHEDYYAEFKMMQDGEIVFHKDDRKAAADSWNSRH